MKRLINGCVLLLLAVSCQPPAEAPVRYTQDSPEITKAKANMKAYFAGDWETMRAAFADTANIYHNNTEPMNADENIVNAQEGLKSISSYELGDSSFWEMIVDDNGDKWVYFWGEWKGVHSSGTSLSVPFHLAWQFEDGLVVEEHGYWDNTPMVMAEQAAAEASAEEEM